MSVQAYHPVIPLHYQIQRLLRSQLESGEWGFGERVPTELSLARRFEVSRTTVREALRRLQSDGLIVRRRGQGTFVANTGAAQGTSRSIKSLLLGYRAEVEVLGIRTIAIPAHVAPALGLQRGERVREFRRVERVDNAPLAVVLNYVRLDVGRRITARVLRRCSMLEVLRDRLKLLLGPLRQSIEAQLPSAEVATLLGSDVTGPVLAVRLVVHEQDGRPLQVCDAYYRGDRYRYEMETTLPPTGIAHVVGVVDSQPGNRRQG